MSATDTQVQQGQALLAALVQYQSINDAAIAAASTAAANLQAATDASTAADAAAESAKRQVQTEVQALADFFTSLAAQP